MLAPLALAMLSATAELPNLVRGSSDGKTSPLFGDGVSL
jgi:hypothetical protein